MHMLIIIAVSLGHPVHRAVPPTPVYVNLGQSQYIMPVAVPTVMPVKLSK